MALCSRSGHQRNRERRIQVIRVARKQHNAPDPFWKVKSLGDMTSDEWESLCDGCGRCCLVKLEDEDNGEIFNTSLACELLDIETCRCTDYDNRHDRVADCVKLSPDSVMKLKWLPSSCAYRIIAEGGELAWWHPLVSGTQQTVIDAGISVAGEVRSETGVDEDDMPDFIKQWPCW